MIGCALSHLAAWRTIAVRDGGVSLIFEDDARLSPRSSTVSPDLVGARRTRDPRRRSSSSGTTRSITTERRGRRRRDRGSSRWSGTTTSGAPFGYLLTPEGARQLLAHVERRRRAPRHRPGHAVRRGALVAARSAPPIVQSPGRRPGLGRRFRTFSTTSSRSGDAAAAPLAGERGRPRGYSPRRPGRRSMTETPAGGPRGDGAPAHPTPAARRASSAPARWSSSSELVPRARVRSPASRRP